MNHPVPFLPLHDCTIGQVAAALNSFSKTPIAQAAWPQYAYKPQAAFSIAHNGNALLLQFAVAEQTIRCIHTKANEPVYEDSCVEAFIALDESGYYNFEFNCIGTPLAGFGTGKENRSFLPDNAMQYIKTQAIIERNKQDVKWELTIVLPLAIFLHHQLTSFDGVQCSANFYKCGDALPQPHFLAWQKPVWPEPDFHLPQFFGTLQFEGLPPSVTGLHIQ